MFRVLVKKILEFTYKPLILWYLKKERRVVFKGFPIVIHPGVFHPLAFHSTALLVEFLEGKSLEGKNFLEPGCGTGLISVFAASRGALVDAFDKNPEAVKNTELNASENKVRVNVSIGDINERFGDHVYDFILINPPYYRKQPASDPELAWYCGESFEYFHGLFRNLPRVSHSNSEVIMVLSKDCEVGKIVAIAKNYKQNMQLILTRGNFIETNYLFRITNDQN